MLVCIKMAELDFVTFTKAFNDLELLKGYCQAVVTEELKNP